MNTATEETQRQAWFRTLAELVSTPAMLLDRDGGLEHANRAASDLFECPDEEALAAKWPGMLALFGKPVSSGSANLPVGNESRLIGLELHALDAAAGGGYFALLKDRCRFDSLERELLLASECRAWTHESAVLLHDLKGILNSMQISLELLSDPDAEVSQLSADEARREKRIAALKDDLSRINQELRALPGSDRAGDPPIEEFDAREVLKEILGVLRLLARRNNVEVRLDTPNAPLPVRARRAWLRQALLNVASHRLNAMRAGGRLSVVAAVHSAQSSGAAGLRVCFGNDVPDLRDSPPGDLDRSFCAGRRSAANTDLIVARAVFESAGGAMEIRGDVDGRGSVVEMRIPA